MTKERKTEDYIKWLQSSFSSDFGCDYNKVLAYVSKTSSWNARLSGEGVNNTWWTKTAVPYIKSQLGEGAWVMFMGIVMAEGYSRGLDWINHTTQSGGAFDSIKYCCSYIKGLIYSHAYPVAATDYFGGIMSPMPGKAECQKALNTMPNGSIGRYYMCATLAGNAWVWSPNWSNNSKYGNPYDQIMDMINACGGNVAKGNNASSSGSTDSGSGSGNFMQDLQSALASGEESFKNFIDKLFPKAVYLNNSTFHVLGMTFRQYRHYMYIRYPWDNYQGNGSGSGSGGDGSNTNGWYQEMVAELNKIKGKQHSFTYENIRPQQDLTKVNWADCSGFVGWLARKPFPKLWNNGYTNTATMKPQFNGSIGKVIVEGSQSYVLSQIDKLKAGDFFLMGDTSACGAGLSSHVAWCETPDKVWSMEGQGLLCYSAKYFLSTWWSPKPYMSICRPNGDPNGKKSSGSNLSSAEKEAREWIAQRESGGSYTARNGRYYGRYQLDISYLHGDLSPANQDKVADQYVRERYGSWVKAKEFWQVHNWY